MGFEKKIRFQFWVYPETMKDVEQHFKCDNCKSQSEFIEKAIKFYIGYLDAERHVNYLSPMITETVAATIKGTEQHITRILFKVAVELGKLSHMLAAAQNGHCIHRRTVRFGESFRRKNRNSELKVVIFKICKYIFILTFQN